MFWKLTDKAYMVIRGLPLVGLSFLGFGLIRWWPMWIASLESLAISGGLALDMGVVKMTVEVLTALAICLGAKRFSPYLQKGFCVVGSTFLLILGVAILLFADAATPPMILLFGVVFSYVGFTVMIMLWYELYGRLPVVKAAIAFVLSCILSFFVDLLLNEFVSPVFATVFLLLPLLSASMLIWSAQSLQKENEGVFSDNPSFSLKTLLSVSWRLVIWMALFSFVRGTSEANVGTITYITSVGKLFTNVAIAFAILVFSRKTFDLGMMYRVSLPIMIAGLMAVYLFQGHDLPEFLLSVGGECYRALSYIVAFSIAKQERVPAVSLCALVFSTHIVFTELGLLANSVFIELRVVYGLSETIQLLFIVFLIVIASMVFRERDFYQRIHAVRRTGDREPSNAIRESSFDIACETYGISEREKCILQLLAKDMSYKDMSEELFISQGTIRVHVSNIYRKFDVHSKTELLEKLAQGEC